MLRQLLFLQVFFDGDRGLLSRGHSFDGVGRAGEQVAPGKDAREVGLKRHRIGRNRTPGGHFDPFRALQEFTADPLTDGRDNHVTGDIKFGTGHRDRSSAAGLVRLPQVPF